MMESMKLSRRGVFRLLWAYPLVRARSAVKPPPLPTKAIPYTYQWEYEQRQLLKLSKCAPISNKEFRLPIQGLS